MEKVYLLLRHNQVSGPYSFVELKQQQLQPADLIWVEGRSQYWCYPAELEAVIHSHPERAKAEKAAPAPRPAGSRPAIAAQDTPMKRLSEADEMERKAEALRSIALSEQPPKAFPQPVRVPVRPVPVQPVYMASDSEIQLVCHKRKSGPSPDHLMVAALVTAIILTGWFGKDSLFRERSSTLNGVAIPLVSTDLSAGGEGATINATHALVIENVLPQEAPPLPPARKEKPAKPSDQAVPPPVTAAVVNAVTIEKATVDEPERVAPAPVQAVPLPVEVQPAAEPGIEQPAAPEPVVTEKKKTIGQAIKGLFRKKKKDGEQRAADLPAAVSSENG